MTERTQNYIDFIDHIKANTVEGQTRRLVIFHHSDMDGAFAGTSVKDGATAVYHMHSLKRELFVEPVNYNKFTEEEVLALVDGNSDVFVVDFAFPLELSRKLAEKASYFVTIDHHKTSAEAMGDEPWAIFDMTSSGALMAWRFFNPTGDVPLAIMLADNRDLWKKTDGREDQFHEVGMLTRANVYAATPKGNVRNVAYLDELSLYLCADELVKRDIENWGNPVIAKRDSNIAYVCSESAILETTIGGLPAILVNYGVDQSDACEYLYKQDKYKDKIVATFNIRHDGVNFSLRKNAELDLDLGAIAALYGGGGHAAAAGFVTSFDRGFGIIRNQEKWAMVSDATAIDEVLEQAVDQQGMSSALLNTPVKMASRLTCETDKSLLQWLPYLVLRNEDGDIFTYRRPDKGTEVRLHGDLSIGLGGHVDALPKPGQTLANHLATEGDRELVEEVGMDAGDYSIAAAIEEKINTGNFGVLRMHGDSVSEVHLGLAIVLDVKKAWLTKLEAGEVERAQWVKTSNLLDLPMKTGFNFELWSHVVATQTAL